LTINGVDISSKFKNIYAIFDTGTTGCSLSDDLLNDQGTPSNPYALDVSLLDETTGKPVTLSAKRSHDNFFIVNSSPIPWFKLFSARFLRSKMSFSRSTGMSRLLNDVDDVLQQSTSQFRPQIVVLGLAIVKNDTLTVDIDEKRLMISSE
jgi:hypothetical protein